MLLFIKEGPSPMAHVPRCPDMSVVPVTVGLLGIGKSCKRGRKPAQEGVRMRLNTRPGLNTLSPDEARASEQGVQLREDGRVRAVGPRAGARSSSDPSLRRSRGPLRNSLED